MSRATIGALVGIQYQFSFHKIDLVYERLLAHELFTTLASRFLSRFLSFFISFFFSSFFCRFVNKRKKSLNPSFSFSHITNRFNMGLDADDLRIMHRFSSLNIVIIDDFMIFFFFFFFFFSNKNLLIFYFLSD